ncbi:hypothetical protein [Streptomyces griseoaurantiacus]|uniref:hypothetical protein n=1 Tax=Streptomyces griseoaurantiacus TaxID=68213 RepID=UPI0036751CB3
MTPPRFPDSRTHRPTLPPFSGPVSVPSVTGADAAFRPDARDTPPACSVPHFAPVRVPGGAGRLRRLVRQRRRAVAAGLAVTAAALIAAGPHAEGRPRGHPDDTARARASTARAASSPHHRPARAPTVTAPVRIADAATVGLLRPGDRVDVIAADGGGAARVVAAGARVVEVPGTPGGRGTDGTGTGIGTGTGTGTGSGRGTDTVAEAAPDAGTGPGTGAEPGALVLLSVPRAEAARLAGAGAAGRLAVTLR